MTPPRLWTVLLRWCAPKAERAFIQADLADEFGRIADTQGVAAAQRWYRRQVATSIAPLLLHRMSGLSLPRARSFNLGNDVTQALRAIWRQPTVTTTVVGTLTVGLTTTLAAGMLFHGIIVRPLPYERPEALFSVRPHGPRLPASVRAISLPDFVDWQAPLPSIAVLSGYSGLTFTITEPGEPRRADGLRVGPRFAELLGRPPLLGRDFEPKDFVQGGQYVVLLGYGMWQREFGGDPGVIGRSLTMDDRRFEIVGVLPDVPFSDIADRHEFWVPLIARPGVMWEPVRGNGFISVLAKLAPGVSLEAAQQELSSRTSTLAAQYPRSNGDKPGVRLVPLQETLVSDVRRPLSLMLAAVGAVLLVSCGNLLNLLLVNRERRRSELAMRLALGAGHWHIRRQIFVEVGLCVAAATALSLTLAPPLARLFVASYPTPLPSSQAVGLSLPLALTAVLAAVVITVVLSCPQWRRLDLSLAVSSANRVGGSRRDRAGRAMLIGAQVAFTIVLAFAGVALVRSLVALAQVTVGLDPRGRVAVSITPSGTRYPSAGATRVFFEQLLSEVRAIPGVRSAAVSTAVPFVNRGWGFSIVPPEGGTPRMVGVTIASPGFFETLGVQVRRGRLLSDVEHASEQRVVVINELTARLLPYDNPVGRILRYSGIDWTVVGVVAPVVQVGLRTPANPELFLPWSQAGRAPQRLVLDIEGDPAAIIPLVTARVRALDPAAPVADVMLLESRIRRSVATDRFAALLLSSLALAAALLAAFGVWSVTMFTVTRAQRENGIRAALGESRAGQLQRTVRTTLIPASIGTIAGLTISLWIAPLLNALLFGIEPRDPLTLAAAATVVLATTTAAAIVPARRGLRTDPATALRAS